MKFHIIDGILYPYPGIWKPWLYFDPHSSAVFILLSVHQLHMRKNLMATCESSPLSHHLPPLLILENHFPFPQEDANPVKKPGVSRNKMFFPTILLNRSFNIVLLKKVKGTYFLILTRKHHALCMGRQVPMQSCNNNDEDDDDSINSKMIQGPINYESWKNYWLTL